MDNSKIFIYQGMNVRTVSVDGEPWFMAKDVCEILEHSNSRMALERLDDDEKGVSSIDTLGGKQEIAIVNEPGLYSLILGSRKPEAKQFKRWVTHEVIPSIRKHGMYATDQLLDNPDFAIEVFQRMKEERERSKLLQLQNAQKEQIINELRPKATYYDLVLQNKSLLSISKIAKDYGLSAQALNFILHEEGIQFKQGDCWLLYQKYADKGYTQSKTQVIDEERSKLHTYWTQKGRLFIYDLLKTKRDMLPIIERNNESA